MDKVSPADIRPCRLLGSTPATCRDCLNRGIRGEESPDGSITELDACLAGHVRRGTMRTEGGGGMKRKVIAVRAEVYSRVVGYYRPVQDWNRGKKEEYGERHQMKGKELTERGSNDKR